MATAETTTTYKQTNDSSKYFIFRIDRVNIPLQRRDYGAVTNVPQNWHHRNRWPNSAIPGWTLWTVVVAAIACLIPFVGPHTDLYMHKWAGARPWRRGGGGGDKRGFGGTWTVVDGRASSNYNRFLPLREGWGRGDLKKTWATRYAGKGLNMCRVG